MATCANCGADTIDERGICQSCGWRNSAGSHGTDVSSPSLGATRAAEIPAGTAIPASRHTNGMTYDPSGQMAPTGTPQASPTAVPPSAGTNIRFCGACGARITGNEAFCGQCGAPVSAPSGPDYTMPQPGPASRYHVGNAPGWAPEFGDEPTEAFVPARAQQYARPSSGIPYGQTGFGAPEPRASSTRGLRIGLGILCLVGSLASAVVAVLEALKL